MANQQAKTIPAGPTPNLFSAFRRLSDWTNPLASSSNLLSITCLSFAGLRGVSFIVSILTSGFFARQPSLNLKEFSAKNLLFL
jgi:hypothetical protein